MGGGWEGSEEGRWRGERRGRREESGVGVSLACFGFVKELEVGVSGH